VFLWVKLVVRSLLSGLGKHDDVSDLQRRLRLLPTDLEKLFELMLNRIDPVYMDRASTMYKILRETQEIDEQVTIRAFAFTNDPNSDDMFLTTKCWDESKISTYCKKIEDRMKAQPAGLIEVSVHGSYAYDLGGEKARRKVQYLHRTVRDDLEKPAVWNLLVGHTAHPGSYPSLPSLCYEHVSSN
jgi:hypothetical protein